MSFKQLLLCFDVKLLTSEDPFSDKGKGGRDGEREGGRERVNRNTNINARWDTVEIEYST